MFGYTIAKIILLRENSSLTLTEKQKYEKRQKTHTNIPVAIGIFIGTNALIRNGVGMGFFVWGWIIAFLIV
jgi:RecG-like helicase